VDSCKDSLCQSLPCVGVRLPLSRSFLSATRALYFCRADLSVATPLLIDELRARGLSQPEALLRIGTITSLGTAGMPSASCFWGAWATSGAAAINFLIGLAGATVFTVLFAVTASFPYSRSPG